MRALLIALSCLVVFPAALNAAKYKPIVPHPDYHHDRWGTKVMGAAGTKNYVRKFRAYISVFDGEDDDRGDGISNVLGVPHFVAYEMKRYVGFLKKGPPRPSPWITDKALWKKGIAPKDASYKNSKSFRDNHPNWYVRGHLCMKQHAWRLGKYADWNTHTVINAVPQRQDFNAGIWLNLENLTAKWANSYGAVWIIAGPIFEPAKHTPTAWIGEPRKGEMLVAIPDKLFKIVIRATPDPNRPEVLAFVYPQDVKRGKSYDHRPYLRSIDFIEEKTGLDFLTSLPAAMERQIEKKKATTLWPVTED